MPIKVPISGIRMSRFGQAAAQRPCAKAQAAWRCRFALRAPSLVRRPPDAGPTNPRSRRTRALALRSRTMNRVAIAHDEADEEVKRKIVEKYIKEKHQPGLWEDYGKGLLQVFDIAKLVVTPPHIPWDNDE